MIQSVGLIVVCLTILLSIDDLIWDISYYFGRVFGLISKSKAISVTQMQSYAPKLMALVIAAYHE